MSVYPHDSESSKYQSISMEKYLSTVMCAWGNVIRIPIYLIALIQYYIERTSKVCQRRKLQVTESLQNCIWREACERQFMKVTQG